MHESFSALTGGLGELIEQMGTRVFFSVLCGGMIGLERELKQKPAGIKTNMLICLGSCLFTSVSVLMATRLSDQGHFGDPTRIAAQIVSGIGFLGGGAIIHSRGAIVGLTTAATIWVVAAVGVCIGLGSWDVGLFASVIVLLVLVLTSWLEDLFIGRSLQFHCEFRIRGSFDKIRERLSQTLIDHGLRLESFFLKTSQDRITLRLTYRGHRRAHQQFLIQVWSLEGIEEVRP